MQDLIIFGGGGFGREVLWLAETINQKTPCWNILGFVDDYAKPGEQINGYPVLGDTKWLLYYSEEVFVSCAIGNAKDRRTVVSKLAQNPNIKYPILIAPDVICSSYVQIGEGTILCSGVIVTVNIVIGKHCILNLNARVGHDAVLADYVSVYPGVNISGKVLLGQCSEIGTGSSIIQGVSIGENAILGAGAVVVRDIPNDCTAVGVPAKVIQK
ncbi:transferase [Clostridia bacterium]|nr:transferase [Clostridia bacterium]